MSTSVETSTINNAFAKADLTPYTNLAASLLRLLLVTSVHDMPFLWSYVTGSKNEQADLEGPFYVIGSPTRQIGAGKGVLASPEMLKAHVPFLLSVRILSPEGKPLPNTTLDCWHADTSGTYYFTQYKLRGTVTTDTNGVVEILTVAPGAYGPRSATRPGHIHLIIRPPKKDAKKYDELTTQLYLCKGNDSKGMTVDIVNLVRKARENLVLNAWTTPTSTGEQRYMDLPELDAADFVTSNKVDTWNKLLSEVGDVRVVAGANIDIKLNKKKGSWF